MGVVGALLNLVKWNEFVDLKIPDTHGTLAQVISIVLFTGLCLFLYFDSRRAKA